MSFSFGTPKTVASTTGEGGCFPFGSAATNPAAGDAKVVKPLNFGTPNASTTSTFGLTGFGSSSTSIASTIPTGFSLSTTAATIPQSTTGFTGFNSLGAPTATVQPTPASFATASTATTGFSQGTAIGITTTQPSSLVSAPGGLFASKTTSASATPLPSGFSLGAPAPITTAASPSFSFASTTPAPVPAPATATFSSTVTPISTAASAASTVLSTNFPTNGNFTFAQLDDAINKWTLGLEEQGKLFSNQAKQLNAWDRVLVKNGEQVLALNGGIKRVKQQQQQLDQELDFVLAQEKELEDLITPLEKELNDIPLADVDRLHTYQLAENMDTQLKQMSEDLKEIIEQLNESNKSQENSNPMTQIRKILNAHFDSLQWIDRQTSKITSHLDQISKMHDLRRKTHEQSLKKTYEQL